MTDDSCLPVHIPAGDRLTLAGDLAVPAAARGGAVICHPHPAFGGDRHNTVVDALFRALPARGLAALRFDFRPGADRDAGAAAADVVAALDRLVAAVGEAAPVWLAGYSFGGDVALSVADPRHRGWAVVAPPLRFGPGVAPAAGDPRPALVVVPEHDQYSPPAAARAATAGWPAAEVEVVGGADHFMAGYAGQAAGIVATWLAKANG